VVVAVRTLYSAVDALDALRHWAEQFAATLVERAENVAWLLRQGGYAVEVIAEQAWSYIQNLENKAEALVGALTASAFKPGEVASALQKRGIPVDVAGKVSGPFSAPTSLRRRSSRRTARWQQRASPTR
jgi:hypothetical protein